MNEKKVRYFACRGEPRYPAITRFVGERGMIYGSDGSSCEANQNLRWHEENEPEVTEDEAINIVGGRPWEPQSPATATQPAPTPTAFSVQIGGDHYKNLPIQPIEYCQRNGLGAVESFVVKYVTRWKAKGGVDDLRKAIHLLEMLVEMEKAHAH